MLMSPATVLAGAVVGAAAGALVGAAAGAVVAAGAAGFAAVGCAAGGAAVGAGAVVDGPHAARRAVVPMASDPGAASRSRRKFRLLVKVIKPGPPLAAAHAIAA